MTGTDRKMLGDLLLDDTKTDWEWPTTLLCHREKLEDRALSKVLRYTRGLPSIDHDNYIDEREELVLKAAVTAGIIAKANANKAFKDLVLATDNKDFIEAHSGDYEWSSGIDMWRVAQNLKDYDTAQLQYKGETVWEHATMKLARSCAVKRPTECCVTWRLDGVGKDTRQTNDLHRG